MHFKCNYPDYPAPVARHTFRMANQASDFLMLGCCFIFVVFLFFVFFFAWCAVKVNTFFPDSLPFLVDQWLVMLLYQLIHVCYLCFKGVPGPSVYLFWLVLAGLTNCTTCIFRTTKLFFFFFFSLSPSVRVCVRVWVYFFAWACATKFEIECVKFTASYLEVFLR